MDSDGHIGFIKAKLEPVDEEGTLLDEEEMEELVEEPEDLIEKNLSCHMKISFTEMVLYNVVELLNKKVSVSYTIMTGNGEETFYTPTYVVKDNQVPMFYSQIINIEKVTLEIIQYYMNKKMHIQFYTESTEPVEKLGKLPNPKI